jgi:hypothetical protein
MRLLLANILKQWPQDLKTINQSRSHKTRNLNKSIKGTLNDIKMQFASSKSVPKLVSFLTNAKKAL